MKRGGVLGFAVLVLAAVVLGAQPAFGAVGDLSYQDCVSSNSNHETCTLLATSNAGGTNTPFDGAVDVAESPAGDTVYLLSANSDAVNWLTRDPATGALTFAGCLTANTGVVGCPPIAGATGNGTGSGMGGPNSIAITPDGRNAFVTSVVDDALARFTRDTTTGALTYDGCVSSQTGLNTKCTSTPVTSADGAATALQGASGLAIAPDGATIYTTSLQSDALAWFRRDPTTAAFLGFQGCVTADTAVASCDPVAGAAPGGTDRAPDGLNRVAVTPDGEHIYGTAAIASAVPRYSLAANGTPTFEGCLASDSSIAGCSLTPVSENNGGVDTALHAPIDIVSSADGKNLYVASNGGSAVTVIARDIAAGNPQDFVGCVTTDFATGGCTLDPGGTANGVDTALHGLTSVAVSPDGSAVYAGSELGDALTRYDRAADGSIVFNSCSTTNTDVTSCAQVTPAVQGGSNTPLHSIQALIASGDGRNLYLASGSDAVSRVNVERPPEVVPPPAQPSNDITIGAIKKNKRKGTAKLMVTVPGAGEVALAGNGLAPKTASATAAGDVTLKVKTTGKKRKKLRRKGKIKVTPLVTFTPTGGIANTESTKVKLIDR